MSTPTPPTAAPDPRPAEGSSAALGFDADVPSDISFEEFDLSEHVLQGIEDAGYLHATAVQVRAIPPILEGREVVVQARTGTGKTAAFGLPLLELLDGHRKEVQGLVLTPTRELARQVADEINLLGRHGLVSAVAVYGGDSMTRQVTALAKGAQLVVGTPGRVLDHLGRGTLKVKKVAYLVLDEADEMLSMGFERELRDILRYLPTKRKTLLFSATFPPETERLIGRHQEAPLRIELTSDTQVAATVTHHYYLAPRIDKDRYLVAVLDDEEVEAGIVFCNRKDETRMVAKMLRRSGYNAMPINSDLAQNEREAVMAQIKRRELTVLVATDIAARGIDISDLSHVINYTVPESPEMYVHRTGRTGRIGRSGTAVTLVGGQELKSLKLIEKIKGIHIEERRLPPEDVVMAKRVERVINDLKRIAEIRSPEDRVRGDKEEFLRVAAELQSDEACRPVLYLLLQTFFEGLRATTSRAAEGSDAADLAHEVAPDGERKPAAARSKPDADSDAPKRRRRTPTRRPR